jgi:hypothetical protein
MHEPAEHHYALGQPPRQTELSRARQATPHVTAALHAAIGINRESEQSTLCRPRHNLDLLLYQLRLRCYVVIELKVGPFKPEYVGKLGIYLAAVDD